MAPVPKSIPDLGVILSKNAPQMVAFLVASVVVAAVAPVFTVRKLQKMYIPGTLRVLE